MLVDVRSGHIILSVLFLIVIAVSDYFLVGRKLSGGIKLSGFEMVIFYFGRSVAEYIMFILGIIVGVYII